MKSKKERGFKRRNVDSRNDDGKYSRNPSETVKNKYCHYWNNGTCRYSDKDCRYLHKEAPECWYSDCTRSKCMFYHPRQNVSKKFFQQGPQWINPWNGAVPGYQRRK